MEGTSIRWKADVSPTLINGMMGTKSLKFQEPFSRTVWFWCYT